MLWQHTLSSDGGEVALYNWLRIDRLAMPGGTFFLNLFHTEPMMQHHHLLLKRLVIMHSFLYKYYKGTVVALYKSSRFKSRTHKH